MLKLMQQVLGSFFFSFFFNKVGRPSHSTQRTKTKLNLDTDTIYRPNKRTLKCMHSLVCVPPTPFPGVHTESTTFTLKELAIPKKIVQQSDILCPLIDSKDSLLLYMHQPYWVRGDQNNKTTRSLVFNARLILFSILKLSFMIEWQPIERPGCTPHLQDSVLARSPASISLKIDTRGLCLLWARLA